MSYSTHGSPVRRGVARRMAAAVVTGLVAAMLVLVGGGAAFADHGISTTDNVNMRTGPSTSYSVITVVPRGVSPTYRCWTQGQSVGGVDVWFNVTYNGSTGYISSYYDNSTYAHDEDITTKYGIPRCGSAPAPTTPAPTTGNPSLEIWFGSPVNGRYPSLADSQPQRHKISYGGDWSIDIPAAAGQQVQVYAAPQDGRSSVTAKVESVRAACRSGVISDGGHVVVVGLYNGSARVGSVTYAHVNPSVSAGQTISRWGGVVGTVGTYNRSSCWDGAHSHVEGFSVKNYSCFNGTYSPGQSMSKSNFLGFVGGARASHTRQACP